MRINRHFIKTTVIIALQIITLMNIQSIAHAAKKQSGNIKKAFSIPVIPFVKVTPVIDGKTADAAWENAALFTGFLKYGEKKKINAQQDTQIKIVTDNRYLYFNVFCEEKMLSKMVKQKLERDSGALWNGCNVEIFIDANADSSTYYHICIDAEGNLYDGYGTDASWNAKNITIKPYKNSKGWGFEMKVDIVDLGYGPMEVIIRDKNMAFNFARNRKLKSMKKIAISTWVHWKDYGLHKSNDFIPATVGGNAVKGSTINFRYMEYTAKRKPMYRVNKKPLFKELLTDKPIYNPKKHHGTLGTLSFNWMAQGKKDAIGVALQHGFPYDQDHILDILQEYKQMPTSSTVKNTPGNQFMDKNFVAKLKARKIPRMVNWHLKYGGGGHHNFSVKNPPEVPVIKDVEYLEQWPLDTRLAKAGAQYAKNLVPAYDIMGFMIGHEETARSIMFYEQCLANYKKQDPKTLEKWDREIKAKYGQGKWGLPKDLHTDPLQNIAFLKWFNEKYQGNVRLVVNAIKKADSKAMIVSDMNYGGLFPNGYENMTDIYDVVTAQMVPSGNIDIPRSAATTKFFKDVYKVDVWPCAHVEHYFLSMTPEEANQNLSDLVRNGSTGFFQYLFDWFGVTYSDYYGAPKRAEAVLNVLEFLRTGNKLKYPKSDTAVFYCNIHEYAELEVWNKHKATEFYAAYAMLGTHAGSWFKYISDFNILNGQDSLENYKIIYFPNAKYIDDKTFALIKKYIAQGGIVVLNNPEIFKFSDFGKNREKLMQTITGIQSYTKTAIPDKIDITDNSIIKFNKNRPISLKLIKANSKLAFNLNPSKKAKVIGRYPNGQPAVIQNSYGQGTVITFGTSPFTASAFSEKGYGAFAKCLQQRFDGAVDQAIWQFKIPDNYRKQQNLWDYDFPKGLSCYTSNAVRWAVDKPIKGAMEDVGGSYTYSLSPDLVAEKDNKIKNISFKQGVLLNRYKSLSAQSVHLNKKTKHSSLAKQVKGWAVAWKSKKAIKIDFKFNKKVNMSKCIVYAYGQMPVMKIIANGQTLGSSKPQSFAKTKVYKIVIDFSSTSAKNFTLEIGKRSHENFYLSEVEFWGEQK